MVYADPPWHFKLRSDRGAGKSADQHYSTMSLADIKALPVASIAGKDSVLFLWATGPHLPDAFDVLKAWGFTFSAVAFVWVKKSRKAPRVLFDESCLHWGLGYTTRQNAEYVLLGRRGRPPPVKARDVHQIVMSNVREHSRKPDQVRERIERLYDGLRVELFARETAPGWDAWGNEVGKFDGRT